MTEIHINDPQPFDDDLVVEKSLRPDQMDEFIGQKDVVNSLKLYIEAAKRCLQDEIEEVAYNRFTKDVTNIEVHEEKIL